MSLRDFRKQRAGGMSERGKLEPWEKFFGDSRAADNVAAFENERFVALFREVERGDERVVPAAKDHDVALGGHA